MKTTPGHRPSERIRLADYRCRLCAEPRSTRAASNTALDLPYALRLDVFSIAIDDIYEMLHNVNTGLVETRPAAIREQHPGRHLHRHAQRSPDRGDRQPRRRVGQEHAQQRPPRPPSGGSLPRQRCAGCRGGRRDQGDQEGRRCGRHAQRSTSLVLRVPLRRRLHHRARGGPRAKPVSPMSGLLASTSATSARTLADRAAPVPRRRTPKASSDFAQAGYTATRRSLGPEPFWRRSPFTTSSASAGTPLFATLR